MTFSIARRNEVVKRLAQRTDNIDAAKWTEAIRIIGEVIYEELKATNKQSSETLSMLNASIATAKRKSKKRN